MLSDEHWSKLRVIMTEHGIYDKFDVRKTIEEILYRLRKDTLGASCHLFLVYGVQFINNLIVGNRKVN